MFGRTLWLLIPVGLCSITSQYLYFLWLIVAEIGSGVLLWLSVVAAIPEMQVPSCLFSQALGAGPAGATRWAYDTDLQPTPTSGAEVGVTAGWSHGLLATADSRALKVALVLGGRGRSYRC